MMDTLFALSTLAAFALIGGAIYLWKRDRKRSLLMLAAGVVLLFNVVMWSTMPSAPPAPPPPAQ